MLSLYMDKTVNRHGATLLFSTHYCEVLDLFNRQDNIWVCQSNDKVAIKNMYYVSVMAKMKNWKYRLHTKIK